MLIRLLFFILCFWSMSTFGQAGIYAVKSGQVNFSSEAPKELISASSKKLKGILDIEKRTFAFIIDIVSFTGFNNTLQREHFNENYMESDKYPLAKFKGVIEPKIDWTKDGDYTVSAKGTLTVHGVDQARTINGKITIKNKIVSISSTFNVACADHQIKIPSLMFAKIAEVIHVKVQGNLNPLN